MKSVIAALALLIVLFAVPNANAQVYGKIFTKGEANTQFGNVVTANIISVEKLRDIANQAGEFVFLAFEGTQAYIVNKDKNVIFPKDASPLAPGTVYGVYSTSKVIELLDLTTSSDVAVEKRESVISITSGSYTLELIVNCPPICD